MRIRREKDDSLTVTLPMGEAVMLKRLPARLRGLIEEPDFTSRAVGRLFPRAYADGEKEAEYRKLLGDDLRQRKLECIRAFESTLAKCSVKHWNVDIRIRPEEFELWLGFVNDMRLVLGMELDIQDDDWGRHFDPAHPRADELALLHYLSWLEEEMLRARSGDEYYSPRRSRRK